MTAATSPAADYHITLPIYTCQLALPLYLSPAYLAQPIEGVREQLNRSVLRYVEQLGGVLLSYSNLQLQQPLGRIAHDAPEVHVNVGLEATYFAPKAGDVLAASVSRVGGDHIALLVLGVFNATVPHPPAGAGWPTLRADDAAHFVVSSVSHAHGLISIQGDLVRSEQIAPPGSARRRSGGAVAHSGSRQKRPAPASAAAAASAVAAAALASPGVASANGVMSAAAASSSAAVEGSGKRKRTPEEKEERRKKKEAKRRESEGGGGVGVEGAAAATASSAAEPAPAASAAPLASESGGAVAAAGEGGKPKRTKEEKEERRKRKAMKAAAP